MKCGLGFHVYEYQFIIYLFSKANLLHGSLTHGKSK